MKENNKKKNRRDFLKMGLRGISLAGLGGLTGIAVSRSRSSEMVWQLDPDKCTACGKCATYCVLEESAVKCVHAHAMCGYCKLCTGFFDPEPNALDAGAENQLCPTGALKRSFVEDPYYEYIVDTKLCIGCGKCVAGCGKFGNGSLYLQVCHDRCVDCNECSIAVACPSGAFKRVPADHPYILKENKEKNKQKA